jgi:transposase
MLRPIDRTRRDGPLYPGAAVTLRAMLPPTHRLIRIDTSLDLASAAEPLAAPYRTGGRPAIHPEIVLRALLLGALYGVPSVRQLCDRIAENLAWRWFCHLTLTDPIFDHSTLSVFLERVGAEALQTVLARLNEQLAAAGLLSSRTYLDSSLLPAAVSQRDLDPHDPGGPPLVQDEATGTWQEPPPAPGPMIDLPPQPVRYQDQAGRLTLSPRDPDARWRTQGTRSVLGYKEHLLADASGFILARHATPADATDAAGAMPLLDQVGDRISRLTADSGYRAGFLRRRLRRLGISSYIPVGCRQELGSPAGFIDHLDHLVCPMGKRLLPAAPPDAAGSIRFRARAADCRDCALRRTCVSASRGAKALWASTYRLEFRQAARRNQTARAAREQRRRQTVVEGVFAHLDYLGGRDAHVRGLARVDQRNTLLAIAHNLLKALTKRRFWSREAQTLPASSALRPRASRRAHRLTGQHPVWWPLVCPLLPLHPSHQLHP